LKPASPRSKIKPLFGGIDPSFFVSEKPGKFCGTPPPPLLPGMVSFPHPFGRDFFDPCSLIKACFVPTILFRLCARLPMRGASDSSTSPPWRPSLDLVPPHFSSDKSFFSYTPGLPDVSAFCAVHKFLFPFPFVLLGPFFFFRYRVCFAELFAVERTFLRTFDT